MSYFKAIEKASIPETASIKNRIKNAQSKFEFFKSFEDIDLAHIDLLKKKNIPLTADNLTAILLANSEELLDGSFEKENFDEVISYMLKNNMKIKSNYKDLITVAFTEAYNIYDDDVFVIKELKNTINKINNKL